MYNSRDMCENSFSHFVAAILIRGHPYISLPIGNDNCYMYGGTLCSFAQAQFEPHLLQDGFSSKVP